MERDRDIIQPEIENIEMILKKHIPKLRLKRLANNVLEGRVVKGEIALKNDGLAIKVGDIQKESGLKLRVYDPDDGELAEIGDFSKGSPELETVHPKNFLTHMQNYKKLLDDLNTGQFYDRIRKILDTQEKLADSIVQLKEVQGKQEQIQASGFQQPDERINSSMDLVDNLAKQFFSALTQMRDYVVAATGGPR